VPDSWDEFLLLADPNLRRQPHAHMAGLCLKVDDLWRCVAGSVVLAPSAALAGPKGAWIMDKEGFGAFRGVVSPDRVDRLLHGVRTGFVPADCLPSSWGRDLKIATKTGEPFRSSSPYPLADHHRRRLGLDYGGFRLDLNGDQVHEAFPQNRRQVLERRIPAWQFPAQNLASLGEKLRLGFPLDDWGVATVLLASPYWLRLERAVFTASGDAIEVVVESRWPDLVGEASVTVMPPTAAVGATEVWAALDPGAWRCETNDGVLRHSRLIRVSPAPGPWRVSLNYRDETVDAVDSGLPTTRHVSAEFHDAGLQKLRMQLFEGRSSSKKHGAGDDAFEQGVATLLHVCGIDCARHPGEPAVDITAFVGHAAVLFVECTWTPPDDDKLTKLSNRADAYRAGLRRRGRADATVQKIIFTGAERVCVSPAARKSAFERHGVVIACREDASVLLDMAARGEPPERVITYLKSLSFMLGIGLAPFEAAS
jgi:hypothetical protein